MATEQDLSVAREDATVALGPKSLGEALRLLRHRSKISRDQLAAQAGVSAGAISNYENDVSVPPAPTLRRLCHALAAVLGCPTGLLWEQLGSLLDQFGPQR